MYIAGLTLSLIIVIGVITSSSRVKMEVAEGLFLTFEMATYQVSTESSSVEKCLLLY